MYMALRLIVLRKERENVIDLEKAEHRAKQVKEASAVVGTQLKTSA